MRGTYNNATLLYDDNNNLIGINLSADSTSEHEWGIKKLRAKFNCTQEKDGLLAAKITKDASIIGSFIKDNIKWFFITSSTDFIGADSHEYSWYTQTDETSKTQMKCGWDERNFAVICNNEEVILKLKSFFEKNDVFITLGGGHVFENAGLILVQASSIPKETIKQTINATKEHHKAKDTLQTSKAFKLLKVKEKEWKTMFPFTWHTPWSYIALSPHGTQYWLNPQSQDILHWGHISLQDIEDWANEKEGTIIKDIDKWQELKYELSLPLNIYAIKHSSSYRKEFMNIPYTEYSENTNWKDIKFHVGKVTKHKQFGDVSESDQRFLYAMLKYMILDDMFGQIGIYHFSKENTDFQEECFKKWISEKPKDKLTVSNRTDSEIIGIMRCLFLIGYGTYGACNVSEGIGLRNLSYLRTIVEAEATYDFLKLCNMLHKNWE